MFEILLLRPSLHCNTPVHFTKLHPTTLHYTSTHFTQLHFTTLRYTSPHFTTLHPTTFHYTSLHFTTLHPTTLHYTSLHFTTLHPTTLHYTSPHFTQLHFVTLHHTSTKCSSALTSICNEFLQCAGALLPFSLLLQGLPIERLTVQCQLFPKNERLRDIQFNFYEIKVLTTLVVFVDLK